VDRRQTARRTPISSKFTKDGKFPAAGGPTSTRMPAAMTSRIFGRVAKNLGRPEDQRGPTWRTATKTKRVAVLDADTGKDEALLGAPMATSRTTPTWGPYDPPGGAGSPVSATRCIASSDRMDGLVLCCATAPTTGCRCSSPTALSSRKAFLCQEHAGRRLSLGHHLLEGSRPALSCSWRDGQKRAGPRHPARHAR